MSKIDLLYNRDINENDNALRIIGSDFSSFISLNDSQLASALYIGDDLVIAAISEEMMLHFGESDAIGKSAVTLFEKDNHSLLLFLKTAYTSATTLEAKNFQFAVNSVLEIFIGNHTFRPIFDEHNSVCAILHEVMEVRDINSPKTFEYRYRESLSYFYQSPVALAILDREDLIFRYANPFYASIIGRSEIEILNQPFRKVLPELDGQGFDDMLEEVMSSKVPFIDNEVPATFYRNGILQTSYVNLTCNPRFDDYNTVCGVSVVLTDVTEQVKQRKKLEEISRSLHGAIALANLGTWEIDLISGISIYSDRLKEWIGYTQEDVITLDRFFAPIVPKFHDVVKDAITAATQKNGVGTYDVEYEILNCTDKSKRILHAQGQTYFNENDEAIKICGTVSDVTKDRKLRLELKRQVIAQTEELATANQQLELANKKMTKAMIDLEISNSNLLRSNDELSQYAYVASHDLQEPLRKIQVYSNLLNQEDNLSQKGQANLDRITKSSSRMSLLIKDLLEFSSVVKSDKMYRPVDLNQTISNILTDFELLISEKSATISIGELPKVNAVALQMNQLFYNLISNALKFSDNSKLTKITVTSQKLTTSDVLPYIDKPIPETTYYSIAIKDNGIGFDVKYADQIFDVFKRLHPKEIYPGSGIGLALCRRIITNHQGVLLVDSKPEVGTTLTIILPDINI